MSRLVYPLTADGVPPRVGPPPDGVPSLQYRSYSGQVAMDTDARRDVLLARGDEGCLVEDVVAAPYNRGDEQRTLVLMCANKHMRGNIAASPVQSRGGVWELYDIDGGDDKLQQFVQYMQQYTERVRQENERWLNEAKTISGVDNGPNFYQDKQIYTDKNLSYTQYPLEARFKSIGHLTLHGSESGNQTPCGSHSFKFNWFSYGPGLLQINPKSARRKQNKQKFKEKDCCLFFTENDDQGQPHIKRLGCVAIRHQITRGADPEHLFYKPMFALIPFTDGGNAPEKRQEADQVNHPFIQFFPEDGNGPELFYCAGFPPLPPNWTGCQQNVNFYPALLRLYESVIERVYEREEDYRPDDVDYVPPAIGLGSCYTPTMSLSSLHRIR